MNKKAVLYFSVVFFLFFFSFCLEKDVFNIKKQRLSKIEKQHLDQKNHPFIVVIPSYNCSELVAKIFKSLNSQTYRNFKVIFIDDGSSDNTFEKAKEHEHLLQNIDCKIIRNEKYKGSTECLYEAAQMLDDDQIILFFEGNCWLTHNNTLEIFNSYYKKYDIWLAYAQHANYRTNDPGKVKYVSSNNIFSNSARRKPWHRARLKSFYAALFKQVPISNFFFRGKFIPEKYDCAYMLPMLEMAKNRIAFLNEVHCSYIKKEMKDEVKPSFSKKFKCMQEILRRKPLKSLNTLLLQNSRKDYTSDLLIFSYDRPLQLYALLESVHKRIKNLSNIAVLYRTSNNSYENGYTFLKETFPSVIFVKQPNHKAPKNFKKMTLKTLEMLKSDYLMFAVDDIIVKDQIDIYESVLEMARTDAYFFSLRLGTHITYCYMGGYKQSIPRYVKVKDNMMAWQINASRGDWKYYPSVDMTIFKKDHIMKIFPKISFRHPVELEQSWLKYFRKYHKREMIRQVGLSYRNSKIVNIPMNVVCSANNKNLELYTQEELLELFEKGYKIDIDAIKELSHNAVHIDYNPTFIQRD